MAMAMTIQMIVKKYMNDILTQGSCPSGSDKEDEHPRQHPVAPFWFDRNMHKYIRRTTSSLGGDDCVAWFIHALLLCFIASRMLFLTAS